MCGSPRRERGAGPPGEGEASARAVHPPAVAPNENWAAHRFLGIGVRLGIIAYDTEATAEAARKKLLELQKEYLIELGDAVVAVREPDGNVKLNQLVNTTAIGAASGGMWGALIGLLFFNPLVGAAIGAGAGALSGRFKDIGIDDKFMKDAAGALTPGQAALCVLVRKVTADKVLPAMAQYGGKVLRTNLTTEQEAKLQEALKS